MLSRKNKLFLLKGLSLFSIIRGYNVLMITLAQYLASIYILAPNLPLREVVFDPNLFVLVLASVNIIKNLLLPAPGSPFRQAWPGHLGC